VIRRLDHVAVAVADTELALEYFSGRLGLSVVATDVVERPHVRLTYLDAGNAYIQLVEPLDADSPIGEGLHHICFGVDDVEGDAGRLGDGPVSLGGGRGRVSAFVPGPRHHGVAVECTEFNLEEDVHGNRGWLDD
jgi:catechol 2,3-dioxygenase-like lactoylglutathione lyase family enzyme